MLSVIVKLLSRASDGQLMIFPQSQGQVRVGEAAEVSRELGTDSNPEIALWDDVGMLGRLVHELRRTYGTDDARRIVLHVLRNSLPSDEVARETRLATQGYTLSVEKTAVLGCFAGTYFMRSKAGRSLTLPIDQTPVDRLEREWRKFRSSALG